MRISGAGAAFLDDARRRILGTLERYGPMTVAELPRGWPVTRVVVRHLIDELMAEGEVAPSNGHAVGAHTAWRITPLGRSRLRGSDGAADRGVDRGVDRARPRGGVTPSGRA